MFIRSRVFTNFNSFVPETYKTCLIKSFLSRCFRLYSDFVKMCHDDDNTLKGILYENSYSRDFVDTCIKEFLNRILTPEIGVRTMPKKDLMKLQPSLGKPSLQIRTRINCVMKNKLHYCNSWIIFLTNCKLIKFSVFLRFCIAYKFKRGGCNATYYGKTKRHFKVRMCEHHGVSALTGTKEKLHNDYAIKEHHLFFIHLWHSNNNNFKFTLMESLSINRDPPPLNKKITLVPSGYYHMIAVDWSSCSHLVGRSYCFIKWIVFYS